MRTATGYTVVEVLIVLSISSVLMFAAMAVFSGRQRATEFTASMQDVSSKMRSYINEVAAADFPKAQSLTCRESGSFPVISTSGTLGTCIFLGRAVQATTDTLYFYPVIGLRQSGGVDAQTLEQAKPSPAVDDNTPANWILVDEYKLLNGVTTLSAKVNNTAGFNLAGLYSALNSGSPPGAHTINSEVYGYTGNDPKSGGVLSCIKLQNNSCPMTDMREWKICFKSGSSDQKAELTLSSYNGGVTTKLNMDSTCTA